MMSRDVNLISLTVVEAATRIRSGSLSPVEYVQALLERVDAVEPRVKAWTTIDREAVLAEARQMEAEARKQQFRGPLHGVPIGIKDIFYTKNLKTTMGSTAFADFVPTYDASVVRKLKHAGALIMGKCVTTVLVFLDPGPTRNPWNTEHTPGGSSSGSAASVGARMCPASIGSQTVGSVGRPGAYNGVVSIMPTQARVSMAGAFPLAWSLDHAGLFSRSVADIEALLECLSETPMPSHPRRTDKHKFRIGIARGFFFEKAEAEVRQQIDALALRLSDSGFQVSEVAMPAIFDLHPAILRTIVRSEAAATHEQLIQIKPDAYGPKLRDLVQLGETIDATFYLRAQRIRKHYQRDMVRLFQHFDVILTPGAPGPAPHGMATGDPVMQAPWTLADFPTMTLPCGLAANGLPLGIQLAAAPMHEGLLLEVAKEIEETVAFREKPNF
jgi:aspartyl-tRNA(Asn)/glutamyl-tRNA(Gln) amidotransferase subunit A